MLASWPFNGVRSGLYLGDDPVCSGRSLVFIDGATHSLLNEQVKEMVSESR